MRYLFRTRHLTLLLIVNAVIFAFSAYGNIPQYHIKTPISSPLLKDKNPADSFIIYILLGYAGSGKGTFAQILHERGYAHLSLGDFLRKQLKQRTPLGLKYKKEISSSVGHVPEEIIDPIVYAEIKKFAELKEVKGIILDGYPKTIEQADNLEAFLIKEHINYRIYPILLQITKDLARERILNREVCEECGKIYNKRFNPSKIKGTCDKCRGKLVQRKDITEEHIQNKFKFFEQIEQHIVDYYDKKNILVQINANRRTEDNVKEFIKHIK